MESNNIITDFQPTMGCALFAVDLHLRDTEPVTGEKLSPSGSLRSR